LTSDTHTAFLTQHGGIRCRFISVDSDIARNRFSESVCRAIVYVRHVPFRAFTLNDQFSQRGRISSLLYCFFLFVWLFYEVLSPAKFV